MEWLKKQLQESLDKEKERKSEAKKIMAEKLDEEMLNIERGQNIIREVILPLLKEAKDLYDQFNFHSKIIEAPIVLENTTVKVIGQIEFYIKKGVREGRIIFKPMKNIPEFSYEIRFMQDRFSKQSLEYSDLTKEKFEEFLKPILIKLISLLNP